MQTINDLEAGENTKQLQDELERKRQEQLKEELDRRRQELDQKAAELAAREEALRQNGEFRREHNWPPLPSFCPFKPCYFQDINVDIRPEFQRTVQLGYHLWISFFLIQLLNLACSIVLRVSVKDELQAASTTYALITVVFFVPLTYMAWFRPLYKAFKNDSSFNFMIFFFVFFMQTLVVGLWSLGIQSDGPAVGFFIALSRITNSEVPVILKLIIFIVASCWIAYTTASVFYLFKVHSIYRSSGASMSKARNEFTQGVISNRYVQQTVANVANQTVNQAFGRGGPSAGNNQAGQASSTQQIPTLEP